jgi:large subunit ribosomal protein L18
MDHAKQRMEARGRIRDRIRSKVEGSNERPRIAVFRSLKHIYAQAIDDATGTTVATASSMDKQLREKVKGSNVASAKAVGELIADRLKEKGVTSAVFDRGGYRYHGKVKALAEAARAKGLSV